MGLHHFTFHFAEVGCTPGRGAAEDLVVNEALIFFLKSSLTLMDISAGKKCCAVKVFPVRNIKSKVEYTLSFNIILLALIPQVY